MLNVEQGEMTIYEVDAAIKETSDQIAVIVTELAAKTGMRLDVVVSDEYMTGEGKVVYDTSITALVRSRDWWTK